MGEKDWQVLADYKRGNNGGNKLSGKKKALINQGLSSFYGGEAGIRTLGGDKPSTVFKTAAFGHSATSPKPTIIQQLFFYI